MADAAVLTSESTQAELTDAPQAGEDAPNPQAGDGGNAERTYSETAYRKVQSEAKNLRERLKQYEEAETQALPELDRLKKERTKLDSELTDLRNEIRTGRITSAAVKAGALYPDAVVRLVPDDADDYEKAIRDVQKAYPALFPKGNADGGAGTNGAHNNELDFNSLIRQKMGQR